MKYRILLILVLLVLFTTPVVAGQLDRHTLGFPDKAQLPEDVNVIMRLVIHGNESSEYMSLVIYPPILEETPESLKDVEKLINSGRIPLSTRDFNRLRDISDLGVIDAISRIENEDLKKLLQNLYTSNSTLTYSEIEQLLSYIKTLKAQGKITPVDEILAMRALMELLSSSDDVHTRELFNNIVLALRELESKKFASSLVESLPVLQLEQSTTNISEQSPLPRLLIPQLGLLPSLPHLKPPLLITLPQQLVLIVISSLLAVTVVLLLHSKARVEFSSIFTGILHRAKTLLHRRKIHLSTTPPISGFRDIYLDMYWNSVNIIEALTSIKREASTTHREYLEQVREKLRGELLSTFTSITKAYEAYRYACSKSTAILIAENYKKLVSSIGVKTNNTSS